MAAGFLDLGNAMYEGLVQQNKDLLRKDGEDRLLQGMKKTAETYYSSKDSDVIIKKSEILSKQLDTAHKLEADKNRLHSALFVDSFPSTDRSSSSSDLSVSSQASSSSIEDLRQELNDEKKEMAEKVQDSSKDSLKTFLSSERGTKQYDAAKFQILEKVSDLRQQYPIEPQRSTPDISSVQYAQRVESFAQQVSSGTFTSQKFSEKVDSVKSKGSFADEVSKSKHVKRVSFADELVKSKSEETFAKMITDNPNEAGQQLRVMS